MVDNLFTVNNINGDKMILNVALRLGCYMICEENKIPRVDFFLLQLDSGG